MLTFFCHSDLMKLMQMIRLKIKFLLLQVNLFQKLTTSEEHVVYQNCSECQTKQKQQFVYTTCSTGILNLQYS